MTSYDAYDDSEEGATQIQSDQQEGAAASSTSSDQKKAIGVAGVGLAGLGAAAYGLSMMEDGENSGLDDGSLADGAGKTGPSDLAPPVVAHTTPAPVVLPNVPDLNVDHFPGLTGFDKAFHEARLAHGGGGGTFQYTDEQGNTGTYNTYTHEEEAALTPEQRNEFLASNNLMPPGHGHQQEAGTALASTDPDNFPQVTVDPNPPHQQDHVASNDPDVSVITVDGHNMAIFDTNHDHQADVALADDGHVMLDTDGDHKYDSEGTYNAQTHQVDNIHALDHQTDSVAMLDHDLPGHDSPHDFNDPAHDFDNQADVSDFT